MFFLFLISPAQSTRNFLIALADGCRFQGIVMISWRKRNQAKSFAEKFLSFFYALFSLACWLNISPKRFDRFEALYLFTSRFLTSLSLQRFLGDYLTISLVFDTIVLIFLSVLYFSFVSIFISLTYFFPWLYRWRKIALIPCLVHFWIEISCFQEPKEKLF